ncbi:MAG: ribonuclease P protein component [Saprospiraceae bacterium]|nr:ribonuclease P protein component [Saprospiraceae bacterium]
MSLSPKKSFTKSERLKSKKQIGLLFKNKQSIGIYPLRIFWAETDIQQTSYPAKATFSVSKKTFKKAVKRNFYKRLMREVYRKHKHILYQKLQKEKKTINLLLLYVGKDDSNYELIEKKYLLLIDEFFSKLMVKK